MSLFYVLSFFKKVEIIQGGILIKEVRYFFNSSISSQSKNHFFNEVSINKFYPCFFCVFSEFLTPFYAVYCLMSARVIELSVLIVFQNFSTVNFTLKQKWFWEILKITFFKTTKYWLFGHWKNLEQWALLLWQTYILTHYTVNI